jgi:hypothetical protein
VRMGGECMFWAWKYFCDRENEPCYPFYDKVLALRGSILSSHASIAKFTPFPAVQLLAFLSIPVHASESNVAKMQ